MQMLFVGTKCLRKSPPFSEYAVKSAGIEALDKLIRLSLLFLSIYLWFVLTTFYCHYLSDYMLVKFRFGSLS
jgi:hypothetical protein